MYNVESRNTRNIRTTGLGAGFKKIIGSSLKPNLSIEKTIMVAKNICCPNFFSRVSILRLNQILSLEKRQWLPWMVIVLSSFLSVVFLEAVPSLWKNLKSRNRLIISSLVTLATIVVYMLKITSWLVLHWSLQHKTSHSPTKICS